MKKYLLTPVVFCISLIGFAQLSTNEVPLSFKENLNRDSIPQVKLSAPDFNQINKQDSIDNLNGLPPRFGYGIEVNLTTENSGKWVDLPNSRGRLWQLEIYSPGALSINLLYDKFYIPPGGKFFVYSVDKKKILGAFTERNNKGDKIQPGAFATSLILKDRIIIEYFNPSYSNEIPIISVNKVVHGYKYITPFNFGDSDDSCEININCPLGENWQDEKTSVALIVVDGTRWCTGSLINNTLENGAPYLLTADHCLCGLDAITNPYATTWTFLWNYESPTCENGTDFNPPSTSGATVIANNPASDFALLQLDETPYDLIPSLCLYYNGWSRSNNAASNTTGIHHPMGDIKKISVSYSSPSSYGNGNFWQVIYDQGIVERGSSGSPLYNQSSRVVGQLYGTPQNDPISCQNPDGPAIYGKFSVSWDNSTNSKRRLKDWLDPISSIPLTLNGAYLFPANYCNISGPNVVCSSGASFTLNNLPTGCTIEWSSGQYLARSSPQGSNPCTFTATSNGSSWIQATINSSSCGSITLPKKTVWAGKPILNSIAGPFPPYIYKGCTGQQYTFYTIPARDPVSQSSYQWMVEPGYLSWYFMYQYYDWVTIVFNDPSDYYQVIARASNTCGNTEWKSTLFSFKYIQIMDCYYFSMYPNPASEYITITLTVTENDKDFVRPSEFNVQIIDNVGISYYSTTKTEDSFTIPVSHLKDGNYFVRITYGNKIESLPLIIKH